MSGSLVTGDYLPPFDTLNEVLLGSMITFERVGDGIMYCDLQTVLFLDFYGEHIPQTLLWKMVRI